MPRFDVPCQIVWRPKCDCELLCLLTKPALSADDMDACLVACAAAVPACNDCGKAVTARSNCETACGPPSSAAQAACLAGLEDGDEFGAMECSNQGRLMFLDCTTKCATVYAGRLRACRQADAQCRAGACEAQGDTYSQELGQCERTYGAAYADAYTTAIDPFAACYPAQQSCLHKSAVIYLSAVRTCFELPDDEQGDCLLAADSERDSSQAACLRQFGTCKADAVSLYNHAMIAIRSALLGCAAQAEAKQRARDDRMLQEGHGIRLKRAVGDRNDVLCLANGKDGASGQNRYQVGLDEANAIYTRCVSICRLDDDFAIVNACIAGCNRAKADATAKLDQDRLQDVYDCYKQRYGETPYTKCGFDCDAARLKCQDAGGDFFTCLDAYTACVAACFSAHQSDRICPDFEDWSADYTGPYALSTYEELRIKD